MEKWKDIKDYEGLYQISNFGNIRRNNKILKPFKNTSGYYQIVLYKKSKKEYCLIHKLVANTFVENKNNYEHINHKDENKLNNNVNNLEWCTAKYNCNYGTRNKRLCSPVICIELNKKFDSIKKASELFNIHQSNISKCCLNKKHHHTAGGYHWRYA